MILTELSRGDWFLFCEIQYVALTDPKDPVAVQCLNLNNGQIEFFYHARTEEVKFLSSVWTNQIPKMDVFGYKKFSEIEVGVWFFFSENEHHFPNEMLIKTDARHAIRVMDDRHRRKELCTELFDAQKEIFVPAIFTIYCHEKKYIGEE